jgi:hypothetical protein
MGSDLLQSLQIVSQLGVNAVGKNLRVFTVDDVLLSVEEPGGDLVVCWVLDDGDEALEFVRVEISGTSVGFVSRGEKEKRKLYRLERSTSAFLQTTLE